MRRKESEVEKFGEEGCSWASSLFHIFSHQQVERGVASFPQGRNPRGASWNRRNFVLNLMVPEVLSCHRPLPTFRAAEAADHPTPPICVTPLSSSVCVSSPYLPFFPFPTLAMIFARSPLEQSQPLSLWALSKAQLILPFHLPSQICLHCHLYLWSLDKDTGKRILSKWVHLPARSLELAGF